MKILHTADWHIGKQLKKIDFTPDLQHFFDWLVQYIAKESIDVLLVSGDVFDMANPSQAAMLQYYSFLKQMIRHNPDCKIVITGGNHDAPMVLDAPADLLSMLDITVVGGAPNSIADLFVEIERNNEKLVVAAVPFLRDRDVRQAAPAESYSEKVTQVREGIANYYAMVNQYYDAHYKGLPFIVMGHLFAQGVQVSDSERDIQIGNQASVDSGIFGDQPDYVALGHIHKPQMVGVPHVRYSGSPVPFSFSERADKKEVVEIEFMDELVTIAPIAVPVVRKMLKFTGNLNEVVAAVQAHQHTSQFLDLAEVEVIEAEESREAVQTLLALVDEAPEFGLEIVKHKITFQNQVTGTAALLAHNDAIGNYTPMQLFEKRLELDQSLTATDELKAAFAEILQEVQQQYN
jgi:DNA repair protein SbcD/Mre11